MDALAGFTVVPQDEPPGAHATFPFDRALLERFRAAFPVARWRQEDVRWFVPGTTAERRVQVWIDAEVAALDAHGDARGRDAYAFEPLTSPYLEVGDDLVVRTAYARAVVDLLRETPWARWDPAIKAWRLPFRAYETLKARWPAIEAAAQAAESRTRTPEARSADAARAAERRRRRHAVPADDPPPLGEPIATAPFGVVLVEALDAEPIEGQPGEVWAHWRVPTWRELAETKPAVDADWARAWWRPTEADLAERRRRLREGARARATRAATAGKAQHGA